MNRHKHADLMIAYANDTSLVIEVCEEGGGDWCETSQPLWRTDLRYRIKPEPKKAYVYMYDLYDSKALNKWATVSSPVYSNLVESRLRVLNNGYEATDIKEVVFK